METVYDKKGETRQKEIESYMAQKYQVKTTFTMTKLKLNPSEVNSLLKFKSFEEYLAKGDHIVTDAQRIETDSGHNMCTQTFRASGTDTVSGVVLTH